jgi:tRNA-dihydrouridine synthase
MSTKIVDLDDLRERASILDGCDCFILLNGGARSSKAVRYFTEPYEAENEMWGSENEHETDVFTAEGYVEMGPARENLVICWEVVHEIDGTYAEYTDDEALKEHTHIIEALEKGALFAYG